MKRSFIASLILVSLILLPIVISASISVDKSPPDYYPSDTVIITGNGFASNEDVLIEIWDQTSASPVYQEDIQADSIGDISTTYVIPVSANKEQHDVYASAESLGGTPATTYFNVLSDDPLWSNLQHNPTVVTMIDDVEINVIWYDNTALDKILIWENSTSNWLSHPFSG